MPADSVSCDYKCTSGWNAEQGFHKPRIEDVLRLLLHVLGIISIPPVTVVVEIESTLGVEPE